MRDRWLVLICAVGVGCFLVTYGIAMALYPGGTWYSTRTVGHSFWSNFLCDLMQTRALNGQSVPVGSMLARIGSYGMVVGLAAFYTLVARLETPVSRTGKVARWSGIAAALVVCVVPLVPSNLARDAHVISVVVAFFPGLIATIAALIICMRTAGVSSWSRAMASITLIAGACNGFAYMYVYAQYYRFVPVVRSPLLRQSLPVFQRIATIALLIWIAAICVQALVRDRAAHQ